MKETMLNKLYQLPEGLKNSIGLITLITLIIGIWWFLLGNGEKRLEKVFDEYR